MPEPVNGSDGTVAAVRVREAGPQGMITLRGDLSDEALAAVVTDVTGAAMPERGRISGGLGGGVAWMSPDELLLLTPYEQVEEALGRLGDALDGRHHLAVSVSDARVAFAVEGEGAREVLAKLAPVDLHPDAFRPGRFRRSRLGQIAAAFWMRTETEVAVICFRSVADYAAGLLADAAAAGPVGHFRSL